MLLQFNFKNYRSFRDATTLDLSATNITENKFHIRKMGYENILPIATIWGSNASGKSNLIDAFLYMSNYVVESFGYGGEQAENFDRVGFIPPTPFLFDPISKDSESEFEVYFISPKDTAQRTYQYGFSVNQDGILEEWLNYKAKSSKEYQRIFYRKKNEIHFGKIDEKSQSNLKVALEHEALLVSLGAKLKVAKLKFVRDWFLDNEFADFGRPIENYFLSTQLPEDFVSNEGVRNKVIEYFTTFDPSIVGFDVEVIEEKKANKPSKVRIDSTHRIRGSSETASIPLKHESSGTLKMFALFPMLSSVLEKGSILFVDELNANLHPLLLRNLQIMFLDPSKNPNSAQLIYTTHDLTQISELRRDEIWFTEKDLDGVSSLYSLFDIQDENGLKIRKDENYRNNYLLGKYGAIPLLEDLTLRSVIGDE